MIKVAHRNLVMTMVVVDNHKGVLLVAILVVQLVVAIREVVHLLQNQHKMRLMQELPMPRYVAMITTLRCRLTDKLAVDAIFL